jgi:hypothetical protein
MTDTSIRFPSLANPWILGFATADLLTSSQVAEMNDVLGSSAEPFADGVPTPVLVWCQAVAQANAEFFRFNVDGVAENAEPTRLVMRPGTHTRDYGLGLTKESSTRKLVSVLVLDVVGGPVQLTLEETGTTAEATAGQFLTFPAFSRMRCDGPEGAELRGLALHAIGPGFA